MAEPANKIEGQGDHILDDPGHAGADARLIARAVRERWPITSSIRDKLVKKLAKMALGKHPRAISAARTLARMDALNQADEHKDRQYERIDEGKATERVDVINVVNDLV